MKYLIHADGALPNLALMRLGAHFAARGERVRLVRGRRRELWDERCLPEALEEDSDGK